MPTRTTATANAAATRLKIFVLGGSEKNRHAAVCALGSRKVFGGVALTAVSRTGWPGICATEDSSLVIARLSGFGGVAPLGGVIDVV